MFFRLHRHSRYTLMQMLIYWGSINDPVAFVVGGVGGLLLGSILNEPRERRPLFPFPHMKRKARNASATRR